MTFDPKLGYIFWWNELKSSIEGLNVTMARDRQSTTAPTPHVIVTDVVDILGETRGAPRWEGGGGICETLHVWGAYTQNLSWGEGQGVGGYFRNLTRRTYKKSWGGGAKLFMGGKCPLLPPKINPGRYALLEN